MEKLTISEKFKEYLKTRNESLIQLKRKRSELTKDIDIEIRKLDHTPVSLIQAIKSEVKDGNTCEIELDNDKWYAGLFLQKVDDQKIFMLDRDTSVLETGAGRSDDEYEFYEMNDPKLDKLITEKLKDIDRIKAISCKKNKIFSDEEIRKFQFRIERSNRPRHIAESEEYD